MYHSLQVLPHLSLIISYLMRDLVETQCCAVRNGKQCTISTPTLPLHTNEPKFKALLCAHSMTAICFCRDFCLLNMQVNCYRCWQCYMVNQSLPHTPSIDCWLLPKLIANLKVRCSVDVELLINKGTLLPQPHDSRLRFLVSMIRNAASLEYSSHGCIVFLLFCRCFMATRRTLHQFQLQSSIKSTYVLVHTTYTLQWLCAIVKCDKTNIQSPFG